MYTCIERKLRQSNNRELGLPYYEFDFTMRRKMQSPTSYDVAIHAGVSQSVVSRAFQVDSPIAPATRAKVMASAKLLSYFPNAIARSLITKRSGLAGLLLTESTQRDAPDVLFFLTRALLRHGFQPLLFPSELESGGGQALAQAMAFGVDGVVSCVSLSSDDLAQAQLRERPLVLFNREARSPSASVVACDHSSAARLLASRLFAAGHRRFAVVRGPLDAPVSALRVNGFVQRLQELGIESVVEIEGDYHYESGHAAALALFAGAPLTDPQHQPEVVFCVNDTMALGMLDALRFALMLQVPRDVSVVGFDDIPSGRRPAYLLTTVSQPFEAMAEHAARILRTRVDDPAAPVQVESLSGNLIERSSAQLLGVRY